MKIEQQVCSLELSKRLKELGVRQDSLFIWSERPWSSDGIDGKHPVKEVRSYLTFNPSNFPDKSIAEYSAFTVAELGEMLPTRAYSFRGYYEHKWECTVDLLGDEYYTTSGGDTEANARASMLVYLIEQGLLNVANISEHT